MLAGGPGQGSAPFQHHFYMYIQNYSLSQTKLFARKALATCWIWVAIDANSPTLSLTRVLEVSFRIIRPLFVGCAIQNQPHW